MKPRAFQINDRTVIEYPINEDIKTEVSFKVDHHFDNNFISDKFQLELEQKLFVVGNKIWKSLDKDIPVIFKLINNKINQTPEFAVTQNVKVELDSKEYFQLINKNPLIIFGFNNDNNVYFIGWLFGRELKSAMKYQDSSTPFYYCSLDLLRDILGICSIIHDKYVAVFPEYIKQKRKAAEELSYIVV